MNRLFHKLCMLVVLIVLSTGCRSFAQDSTMALGGLTPNQIGNGSAKLLGHYEPTQKLRLVLGLQHPHLAEEEAFLKELQTKGSPNFQKFLTAKEWNRRFSPSESDEQAVVDWATSQGLTVSRRFPNRLLVDLEAPSGTIEKVFGVNINSYQVGTRIAFANDKDPVIPSRLANIVHSIGGLNSVQVLRPHSKVVKEPAFADHVDGPAFAAGLTGGGSAKAAKPSSLNESSASGPKANITNGAYDPTDIYSSQAYDVQALYNQGHCCNPLNNSGVTPPSSSIAIATAGTQDTNDFAGFQSSYPYLAYHYQQYYIDGTPTCCDGEGTLDFDWSTAWSNSFGSYQNTAMIYLYDGVNNQFSTFTDVYNQILSDQNAKVFSTSWGCEETACTPNSVMDTDHGIFNSMVGQGMTLVAATGDQGATAGCGDAVAVQYPASDPNVVGAGGTNLSLDSNSNYISEYAWTGGPEGCGANDGGSTGGYSSYYAQPSYQNGISGLNGQRYVPDIALNADFVYSPQNFYYGGALQGNGGTSIVAPSVAGFFAQTNAYLDYVATVNGGCYGSTTCSPIGNGNYYLYYFGENQSYAPHYPFYDIVYGCNNNDITSYYGLGYFCAATGYDPVTGWGSFNALQLARAITTYRAYYSTTTASFSGYTQPLVNHWYNTDQTVQWTVSGTANGGYPSTGVAGFSQSWDSYIYDSTSEATPGSGDSFYSGPQFPNATYGYLNVSSAGQGCHTAQVRSWDNSGGGGYQTYGPVCYDTVPPVTTASLSGTFYNGAYVGTAHVTLSPTDASSGVQATYYKINNGSYIAYSSAFMVSAQGNDTVTFYSVDNAGNSETPHSISFTVNAAAAVASFAPASFAFGGTNVGATAAYKVFTLTNTGNISMTVSGITSTGTNASSFTIPSAHQGCTKVAPGSSCTFDVAFTPTTGGPLSASIQIADTATGSPQSVAVSGTGITAGATVSISPASFVFGNTNVGSTAAYKVFTLTNTGTASVVVNSITSSGASFTIPSAHQGCTTVAAKATCAFDVAFTPTSGGLQSSTISVVDNATGTPQTVTVSGSGITAGATVVIAPTSFVFGNTNVGSTAAYKVFTLTNTGSASVVISSITSSGASFTIPSAHQGCTTVAAGATCTFDVAFTPTAAGSLSASIMVADNATGTPQILAVSGTGTTPGATVSISPASFTFGATNVGSTAAYKVFNLTNTGSASVAITSISSSGTNASSFTIPSGHQGCTTVAPGATCTFDVAFTPTAGGSLSASILVTDNASGTPQAVAVSGTGLTVGATVTITPTSFTFATTKVGSTAAYKVFTLTNTGSTSVVISSITSSGTNASSFTIPSGHQGCTTVAAGASCTFDVAFTPTTTGSLTASVLVADNATGTPQSVTVSGIGN